MKVLNFWLFDRKRGKPSFFYQNQIYHFSQIKANTILLQNIINVINKQPSFTIKNMRLQLVKIDQVISVYLSLTGKTVR